jgi:hypothetical protein
MKNTLLLLLFLPFFGFGQTITNGSFEDWDTTYFNGTSNLLGTSYNVENPIWGDLSAWEESFSNFGMSQTTDSYDGDYALILHNWYISSYEDVHYYGSLNSNPTYFTFYYKYFADTYLLTNTSPQAIVSICLYTNNQDTVAFSSFRLDTISEYTKFEIQLNYLNNLITDSVHIMLKNSDLICNSGPNGGVCNLFYVDALEFSNTTTIKEIQNSNKTLLKITDVSGRTTKEKRNTPLFYIFEDGTVEKKIIIE